MSSSTIITDVINSVAWITLNRPDKRNAISVPMTEELSAELARIGNDDTIQCVVITGEGVAFCAGRDVQELNTHLNDREGFVSMPIPAGGMTARIAALPQIVIAMINGPAIGEGLDLALACDLAIAANDAILSDPHLARGVVPSAGCWNLPRLIGIKQATEMLLFGSTVTGQRAAEMGLVNRAVPAEQLKAVVEEAATSVTDLAPTATRFTKQAIEMGKTASREHTMQFVTFARSVAAKTGDVETFTKGFLYGEES